MSITPATHLYIGELPCGCIEVVCADIPEIKKETASTVAQMIKDGYAVKRISIEEWEQYKTRFQKCTHKEKKVNQDTLFDINESDF